MATLWDLLTGGNSLTDGGAPQQQPGGLFSALAGSAAAPMGSGFVPGRATPQAAAAPGLDMALAAPQPNVQPARAGLAAGLGVAENQKQGNPSLMGALSPFGIIPPDTGNPDAQSLATALGAFRNQPTAAGTMTPNSGTPMPGQAQPSFQGGTTVGDLDPRIRDASNAIADAQRSGLPSFLGLPGNPQPQPQSQPLLLGQKPVGLAGLGAPAPDVPAPGATPTMGQGAPGATAISVPGYDGTFTRSQADDGDGRPSQKEWDAAAAGGSGAAPATGTAPVSAPIASGLAAGKDLASASGLPGAGATSGSDDLLSTVKSKLKNLYGNGGPGDALVALGIGMMSGPGGTQRALSTIQQGTQLQQAQRLQQMQLAMDLQKLQQTRDAQAGAISYIKAAYKAQGQDVTDQQAGAIAANSGALSTIVSGTFKDKAATPQLVDVPQPDGSTQKQWITPGSAVGTAVGSAATKTPDAVRELQSARQNWQANGLPDPNDPKNAAFWQDFASRRLGGGGGVSVTLPPAEKASEAAFGAAEGKHFGDILSAGDAARQTQGQLAFMNDAFNQGGGNITTGPFAKSVLAGKQAIQGLTGIDLGGVPESEVVNKLGFGLATSLAKDISARPSQAEFLKGLQNVPGIFMSQPGSRVMMSILNQQKQQAIDLADLVANPDNRKNWPAVRQNYYDTHPLISPFTGKPLNVNDLNSLRASAQQAGIDPATGQAGSSSSAPAVPSWSVVGD